MNLKWSEPEKDQLFEALQKYGADNISLLSKCIPTKSAGDIKYAISLYKLRAEKQMKIDRAACGGEAPLDSWIKLLREVGVDPQANEDIITAIKLLGLLEKSTTHSNVNLSQCYQYITELMKGSAPKNLDEESMHFVMTCVAKVALMIKNENVKEEESFLTNLTPNELFHKTYSNQSGPLSNDRDVNVLKIPSQLLKMPKDIKFD